MSTNDSMTPCCPTCAQLIDSKVLDDVTNFKTKNEAILKDKIEIPYHSLFMPWVDQPNGYLQLRVNDKEEGSSTLKRPLFLMHVNVVRTWDGEKRMIEIEPLADSPEGGQFLSSGLTGWEMMRFFFLSRMEVTSDGDVKRSGGMCKERGYGEPFDKWWYKFDKNPMRRESTTTLCLEVDPQCPFFDTDLKEKPFETLADDQKAIIAYEYFDGEAIVKLIRAMDPARYDVIKTQLRRYKFGDMTV